MKSKFFFVATTALIATLMAHPQQVSAKIWRVNNNLVYVASSTPNQPCSHCYTDLQAAINDVQKVQPGDTLHVEASPTAYASVTINRRLVLLGPGYFLNENPGLQHNLLAAKILSITLAPGSKGTILKGLSVTESGVSYININDDDITVERCYVERGIYFQNSTPNVLDNIVIRQNYVDGTVDQPGNPGPVNNLIISNNFFDGVFELATNYQGIAAYNVFNSGVNGYGGMVYYNNIIRSGTFVQNTNSVTNVYNNIFHNSPAWLPSGGTNILGKPMTEVFGSVGSTDGKLEPIPFCGCPQIGMFGGNNPYRLSGVPDIPSIYFLRAEVNLIQGSNLPVTVKTRTNN